MKAPSPGLEVSTDKAIFAEDERPRHNYPHGDYNGINNAIVLVNIVITNTNQIIIIVIMIIINTNNHNNHNSDNSDNSDNNDDDNVTTAVMAITDMEVSENRGP